MRIGGNRGGVAADQRQQPASTRFSGRAIDTNINSTTFGQVTRFAGRCERSPSTRGSGSNMRTRLIACLSALLLVASAVRRPGRARRRRRRRRRRCFAAASTSSWSTSTSATRTAQPIEGLEGGGLRSARGRQAAGDRDLRLRGNRADAGDHRHRVHVVARRATARAPCRSRSAGEPAPRRRPPRRPPRRRPSRDAAAATIDAIRDAADLGRGGGPPRLGAAVRHELDAARGRAEGRRCRDQVDRTRR